MEACEYERLPIKWLLTQGIVNINVENDRAFRIACFKGHLHIAKFLKTHGANINANNDEAYRMACLHGKSDIARWLSYLGVKNVCLLDKSMRYLWHRRVHQL